jgi:hypothetical protein
LAGALLAQAEASVDRSADPDETQEDRGDERQERRAEAQQIDCDVLWQPTTELVGFPADVRHLNHL